mgnify:CR=1 FL=1
MSKMISLIAVLALCAGCGTINPAVYGKTFYKQSFEDAEPDTVTADGQIAKGQVTKYNLEIKAPAGVKLDDITGMEYTWDPEKGRIAVNKSGTTDTTGSVEVINATTSAIGSGVNGVVSAAAALTGQKLQFDAEDSARDDANDAALEARIANIVERVIDKKLKPKPAGDGMPEVGVSP